MKKIVALILSLLMVASMVPVMALTSSAAAATWTLGKWGTGAETWCSGTQPGAGPNYLVTQFVVTCTANDGKKLEDILKNELGYVAATGTTDAKWGANVKWELTITGKDGTPVVVNEGPSSAYLTDGLNILRFGVNDNEAIIKVGDVYTLSFKVSVDGVEKYTASIDGLSWSESAKTPAEDDAVNCKHGPGGTELTTKHGIEVGGVDKGTTDPSVVYTEKVKLTLTKYGTTGAETWCAGTQAGAGTYGAITQFTLRYTNSDNTTPLKEFFENTLGYKAASGTSYATYGADVTWDIKIVDGAGREVHQDWGPTSCYIGSEWGVIRIGANIKDPVIKVGGTYTVTITVTAGGTTYTGTVSDLSWSESEKTPAEDANVTCKHGPDGGELTTKHGIVVGNEDRGTTDRSVVYDPNVNDEPIESSAKLEVGVKENLDDIHAGDTITVSLDLTGLPAEGVNGWQVKLNYDPELLTPQEITLGKAGDIDILGGLNAADGTVYGVIPGANGVGVTNFKGEDLMLGYVTFTVNTAAAAGTKATIGAEVTELFCVNEDAESGNYEIDITGTTANEVSFTIQKPRYTLGDVNEDGKINAQDRTAVARYVAKWSEYGEDSINMLAADVNGDGKVNAQDRTAIARNVAGWKGYEEFPVA